MGFCLTNSYCKDQSTVNIHISVGIDNHSSRLNNSNSKKNYCPQYAIQDIGYNIKINLIFFCNSNILKNSYTYKFQLFIDNSDIEEENLISLGCTEAIICQSKIQFDKCFETTYYFSKGQRIKISCLENEKNINTSLFYLGKMINGFDTPKLIIEKGNENIGELHILINKDEKQYLFRNKKCLFCIELSNKDNHLEEGDYFLTINNSRNEITYKTEEFTISNNNKSFIFKFYHEIRKHFIFHSNKTITINLYKIKYSSSSRNNNNNKINEIKENNIDQDKENDKNESEKVVKEYEFIGGVNITKEELLNNHGSNSFKLSNGLFYSLFKENIVINIIYRENDYTSFFEYISFQFHLNLIVALDGHTLKNNATEINIIINSFFSILSLYNNEEQKIIYTNLGKNQVIKKATNYQEFLNNENDFSNAYDNNSDNDNIIPVIESIYKGYISAESDKGINKYFIIIVFTDKKFLDVNSDIHYDMSFYKKYENTPMNIKIFNLGEEKNYIETNDINMNVSNNGNGKETYERILFQFYNINKQINKKEKGSKYLSDIPFLVEDFFEIQKSANFTIFD